MPTVPPRYGSAVYGSGVRYTARQALSPQHHTHHSHTTLHPMNDILTNRLDMVGACLTVAQSAEFSPVWTAHAPLDFGTDLAALATKYGNATALSAQFQSAITGPADAKDVAETDLEERSFQLSRALANHFKKTGDLVNRAKVDVLIGQIRKLRDQAVLAFGTMVRDLAQEASADAAAVNRGITAARIAALTGAVTAYGQLLSAPRGAIASRSALGRELETVMAELVEDVRDMDDLVIQFDGSDLARRFVDAWKAARMIVDAGHGPATPPPAGGGGGTPTPPNP